jgi:hypothetical protein
MRTESESRPVGFDPQNSDGPSGGREPRRGERQGSRRRCRPHPSFALAATKPPRNRVRFVCPPGNHGAPGRVANGVRNPTLTPAATSAPVAVPDLRSFCVVVRHLRGQPELGVNRLELVASPPHIGAFWPFRRRVEKVVCSRRRFGVQRDNTTCRFAGIFTGATGLEPATSGVTGRRSNQLNYAPGSGAQCSARKSRSARVDAAA